MRFQFGIVVAAAFVALALQVHGVADFHLAPLVVGGADCEYSDSEDYECTNLDGNITASCGTPKVVATTNQLACKDVWGETAVRCTANNCKNADVTLAHSYASGVGGCTRVGCGE